jgi:hypothetical protein
VKQLPSAIWLDRPPEVRWRTSHPAYAPRYARAIFATNLIVLLSTSAVLAGVISLLVPWWIAGISVAAAMVGTPTLSYALFDPSQSHAASFSTGSLLVAVTLLDRKRPLPLELLGLCLGFATMMRWQDGVLGAMLLPRLLEVIRTHRMAGGSLVGFSWKVLRSLLRLAGPAILLMVPQMLFWKRIYGQWILVPPGPDFLPFWRPAVIQMLFSTWNGAFVWSPVLLVGLVGLFRLEDRRLRICILLAIVAHIYICALLLDWWGGRSFGCRRLVSLAPLAGLGLAILSHACLKRQAAFFGLLLSVVVCSGWNMQMIVCQRYGVMPWNPGNQADYVRHYEPSSPRARRYGLADHPRLYTEFVEAQPWLRSARRRAQESRRRESALEP